MNIELAKEKSLIINDDNSVYIELANKYKKIFEQYLLSNINIQSYDQKIDSNTFFIGIGNPNKRQLVSNLENHLNSKYFYIINDFYIEKLSIEEINYLRNCMYHDIGY